MKWKDGNTIGEENGLFNLYFKDGDGNLLEIIAHSYVKEDVLVPHSPLNVLYVREIGLPVKSVPVFTQWLKSNLDMKAMEDGDIFNFVIGGTAYIVATWWRNLDSNWNESITTESARFFWNIGFRIFTADPKYI